MPFRPENIIFHSKPFRKLVDISKTLVLPGFEGVPLYDVIKFFLKEMRNQSLGERAAAISFNFLLAIPPFFIFLFTLVPYIPMQNVEATLYELAEDVTPNYNTYIIIRDMIHDFLYTHHNGLLSIAFIMGFFTSSNAVMGIARSFNKKLPGFRRRKWWQKRLMALKLTLILIVLLLITVILIIAQGTVLGYIFNYFGITDKRILSLADVARWLLIVLLFFSMLSVIYRFVPATVKKWKFITAGSTFATILMILVTILFSFFVNNFGNYNKIYGSIGTILILMLSIYFYSFILLIGFELNASIRILKEIANLRKEDLPLEVQGLS
ncbi:YihY/virulence factor BrkB family protein [Chitinophaga pinensis]|uniref:YihY/virulence factor BrkB family protein n=1 Tax=Chitinophaga pinensis TaxID=79329 RepID=A0A5C6LS10_9BACT|nr:YihY/virulence factor BrkB family protein [Chitinophaga pinensis]TWV97961.1 YihY/virulence factor BrkB family protein [Chitinophaga pinensis]